VRRFQAISSLRVFSAPKQSPRLVVEPVETRPSAMLCDPARLCLGDDVPFGNDIASRYPALREMERTMKNTIRFFMIIILTLLFTSCTPQKVESPTETLSDDQLALHTLVEFLEGLHNGNYDDAIQLYGGTYKTMIDHNPGINTNNYSALLQNACTVNGAQCLQVKSAGLDKKVSDTEFVLKVELLNADGTLFVLGPCCGGSETDFLPQSVFYFTVMKVDKEEYIVMDMPPYMP